ncbi:MAG TPA: GNAT family N-acetyltransferase [Opitutaceae bacterium]|nr:GNAT family N-acetyltransferase [Opitutaceae bacterium]
MSTTVPSLTALRQFRTRLRDLHERYSERRRPTGLGFAFADRIDYIDSARWDAVTRESSIFLRRDVLRVVEEHGPDNIQPRYAIIFRDGRPAAVLAAQVVTLNGDRLRRDPVVAKANPRGGVIRRLLAPVARTASTGLRERMVVAGNLLSWGFHGIAFAPGEDPAALWPGVAEALYRIRRAERLTGQADFAMVKDLTPQQAGIEILRRFCYRAMETEPNMVLTLDPAWRTYDDYLAALDAKYRRKVKEQVKKLTAAGCRVETITDLGAHERRLQELYLSVQGNASVRLVTMRPTYLRELARACGENFRCTAIRRGGELVGFVTAVRDGDTAIGYYIGFDRAVAAEGLPIYLQLLHATIAHAIEWRCTRLSLGRTALEPKAGLGARPEPMSVWVRHRVPAFNWLLRGLLETVPHAEAPERSPFKTGSGAGATNDQA